MRRGSSVVPVLVGSFLLVACGLSPGMPCEDSLYDVEPSPGESFVATVYSRDCGATTPFNRQVGLRRFGEDFDGSRGSIFAVRGSPTIEISWRDPRILEISCVDCKEVSVLRREEEWGEVRIDYDLSKWSAPQGE